MSIIEAGVDKVFPEALGCQKLKILHKMPTKLVLHRDMKQNKLLVSKNQTAQITPW